MTNIHNLSMTDTEYAKLLTQGYDPNLVVRQPKIAGWRSAEEQGSRGAEERFVQVLSPLPLCPSAATTQSYLGRLLEHQLVELGESLGQACC